MADLLDQNDITRIEECKNQRRTLMENQIHSDNIRHHLSNKIIELRQRIAGLDSQILEIKSQYPNTAQYIQTLEFLNVGIWCNICQKQKHIGVVEHCIDCILQDVYKNGKIYDITKECDVNLELNANSILSLDTNENTHEQYAHVNMESMFNSLDNQTDDLIDDQKDDQSDDLTDDLVDYNQKIQSQPAQIPSIADDNRQLAVTHDCEPRRQWQNYCDNLSTNLISLLYQNRKKLFSNNEIKIATKINGQCACGINCLCKNNHINKICKCACTLMGKGLCNCNGYKDNSESESSESSENGESESENSESENSESSEDDNVEIIKIQPFYTNTNTNNNGIIMCLQNQHVKLIIWLYLSIFLIAIFTNIMRLPFPVCIITSILSIHLFAEIGLIGIK